MHLNVFKTNIRIGKSNKNYSCEICKDQKIIQIKFLKILIKNIK